MESVREQRTLAQHSLIPRGELDLGYREGMAKVEGTVHVRKGKVAEPLGELFADLGGRELGALVDGRRVDLEEVLVCPSFLVLFLERDERVALACLVIE